MCIPMEKLIELLNEYDPFICWDGTYTDNHWSYVLDWHSAVYPKSVAKNVIISKSYWFIKWLVENDKIDLDEINNNHLDTEIFYKQTYWPNYWEWWYWEIGYWYKCIWLYESLLCILAMSDTPIEDLISYLK